MSPTVGLAMIVRDSGATLSRCLESVASDVDEVVVVDTGSTDNTCEVAQRFTDRLYAFPWCDDFSAARQFAFDRVQADWVMWLDADDSVAGSAAIRQTVARCPPEVDAVHWKYVAGRDSYGNCVCEFWRERCVRNDGTWRWRWPVHEVLVSRSPSRAIYDEATVVTHERDPASRRDPRRNLRILQRDYERTLCAPIPRTLLYLGLENADVGEHVAAVAFLERFLGVSQWNEQNYFVELKLADLMRARGLYLPALHYGHRALRRIPRWSAACFSLAETHFHLRDWKNVNDWAERGKRKLLQIPCA